jgi:NitT/TauT family transport system ATP-binding protein
MMPPATVPAPGSSLVTLSGVTKAYGSDQPAISNIDLTIEQESFVSLVGPSGCGKSTLLRLLAGLTKPTSGKIEWPQSEGPRADDLGFVFQNATLLPWASAFENVYLPLKLKGIERESARPDVEQALERVGLLEDSEKLPRELSGGMAMRVSIARALVTEPPVLLMDEPFAALDEFTREKLDDDLLTLWREMGWTVVFVTHSVYESVYLSERILVMGTDGDAADEPGRIVADLTVEAPYPRGMSFRQSSDYFDHCRKVSSALRGEMS